MTKSLHLNISFLMSTLLAFSALSLAQTEGIPPGEPTKSRLVPITLGPGETYRIPVPDVSDPALWCILRQVDTNAEAELMLVGSEAEYRTPLAKVAGARPELILRPKFPFAPGRARRRPGVQPGILVVRNTSQVPFSGYLRLVGSRPFQKLKLRIESPRAGDIVSGKAIDVFGTVEGVLDRILVNDVTAQVARNRFVAFQVPLRPGRNLIEAVAYVGEIQESVRVTVEVQPRLEERPEALLLPSRSLLPREGISPTAKEIAALAKEERIHVVVQYRSPTTLDEVNRYRQAGIRHLYPIPKMAWMVSVPGYMLERLRANPRVRAVVALSPSDRLSFAIRMDQIPDYAMTKDRDLLLNMVFFADVPEESALSLLRQASLSVQSKRGMFNDWTISGARSSIIHMAFLDAVRFIEEIPPPDEMHNDGQRANSRVDLIQAVVYGLTGANVNAGEWDGGAVDGVHGDLAGRVTVIETAGAPGVIDHATHVGGTMAGTGALSAAAGGTPNQWRGMATNVNVFSDTYLFDNLEPEEHNVAINTWNIDLSQNSWGVTGNLGNYTLRSSKYDNVVDGTYGTRIPIVFSAGNMQSATASGFQTVTPPGGTAKNTIVIGAIESDTNNMTGFSSFGPTDDGRLKPDVVAPGDRAGNILGVVSAIPLNNDEDDTQNNAPGVVTWLSDGLDDHFFPYNNQAAGAGEPEPAGTNWASEDKWKGTSMAAPVVSGIIALMLEQYRWTEADDITSTVRPLPSTFKAILTNTAVDLQDNPATAAVDTTFVGPDFIYGFGQADATAAVNMVRNQDYVEADVTAVGEVDNYVIALPPGLNTWEVNLAWDDDPGDSTLPVATAKLVNDLDLVLISPTGTRHYPWLTDAANPGNAATRQIRASTDPVNVADNDHLNNAVQVTVDTPMAGNWTVRVTANALSSSPQDYSLAIPQDFKDLFVRDRQDDDGNPVSPAPWWKSPDIWVDTPDGNPVEGQSNDVYVRVTNRGYLTVEEVHVDLYWVRYVTDLPNFDLTLPFNAPSPPWTHIGRHTLADILPGESRNTPAFTWVGPPIPPAPDPNHFCLFAVLRSAEDDFDDAASIDPDYLTPHNNNITHRNVKVIEGEAGSLAGHVISIRFSLANHFEKVVQSDLVIDATRMPEVASTEVLVLGMLTLHHPVLMPDNMVLVSQDQVLKEANLTYSVRDFQRVRREPLVLEQATFALERGGTVSRLRNIYLKPGQVQPVELKVTVPSNFKPGDSFDVDIMQEVDGTVTGGVSYIIRARIGERR